MRRAACAGRFYPDHPGELRRLVKSFLASAQPTDGPAPKAIIAPHAGYMYSGLVAGSAYAQLSRAADVIRRVVLIGPSHYAAFEGVATSAVDAFATPLGLVPLDKEAIGRIGRLPPVLGSEDAHGPEHCLEVQLPFLQSIVDDFVIVPLLVGDATDEEIASVLDALWEGPETRIVVSSDLSHYHDYQTAKAMDRTTAQLIEALRGKELVSDRACGCLPIRGLLRLAQQRGLQPRTVDLRNSGDTAGTRDQVVGYGAFVFAEGT